ncbi:MAG TPA: hypothetical protein VLJ14_06240 [Ktedonobacterales bacterium]|jgi:hypothetical protein|nr:hypothetical protein [Ktedonobacterales bacterium]
MSVSDATRDVKSRGLQRMFARGRARARYLALAGILLLAAVAALAGIAGSPFARGAVPRLVDGSPTPQTHCPSFPIPC